MKASSPRTFALTGLRLPAVFLIALALFCLGLAGSAQVVRPFDLVFTTNKLGDIAIIGNTLHTSPNPAVRNNSAATNILINNENFMVRVDVDSDTNTFTSSSASFTLPPGGSVMFAKLYWGAGTNAGNNSATGAPNAGLRGQVLLSFNGGTYLSITNTSLDTESSGNRYQGARDITDFVRTNGSGTYQVANVQSSTGSNTLAGWSIAIVYADPTAPPRNLSLFDGYAVVQGTQTVSIPLSGFTTPQFNAVNTRVGVVGYEGDSGLAGGVYTGDQMRLNSTHLPFPADPFTPTNDVFNSTISRLGTRVSAKNPDYTNQLGFDLKVINAIGVLTNNATSANITLTTGGETYYPGVVTFATELYAPNISIPKAVTDLNGGAINPNDVLLYTISVTNSGGDWATNVLLIDPLPANTSYVSNTFQITGGANIGAKTDAAGDDQVDFTNGVLMVRLGMGANATNGGVLSTNQSTSMSFMVRVNANTLNGTSITNQATLSYAALVTGVAFASASTLAAVEVSAGIFGRIFEDVNYAGGAGRSFAASGGVGLANARVELYGAANNFLGFILTDATGSYAFSNVVADAYSIRVVNSSVVSSRVGGSTPGLLPVQTFRTDASTGGAVDLVNLVGGANPGVTDPAQGVLAGAQSASPVLVTNNLYTGGVDFGFNFNTIVNTNSAGQGGVRQFIANANALAGTDRAVVMIPNGTSAPGLNPAYDFTLGGRAVITPATPLPTITDAVIFDATTLSSYTGTPVVQINGASAGAGANGLTLATTGSTIRGLAINGFSGSGIAISGGSSNTIAANVLGADPTGTLAVPNGVGLLIATNSINNLIGGTGAGDANLIAFNTGAGLVVTGTNNVGNEIRRNSIFSNGGLGIDLNNNGVTLNDLNDVDSGGNTLFNSPVITNAIVSGPNLVLSGYARPGSIIELFLAEPDASGFGEGRTYLATVTEGSGADADATSGTYSGSINGVNQGTDNTARFSFTIPLPPGVSNTTIITATATDAAGNTSEFGGNAPVGGLTDLVVVKSGPTTTFSLNNLTYTINVTNNGPAAAVNVAVSDTLPAAVTFVSASSGGVLSNGVVTWPVMTNLSSGARTNYTVTVTAPVSGSITNFASGTTETIDPTPTNNNGTATNAQVITAVTPTADVALGKSGPATVLAGANFTYTLSITNLGPVTATNVLVVDNLPTNVTFVSASSGGTLGASNVVTWPVTSLLSGAVTNFTVTVTAPASGAFTNRASAASPTTDPNPTNNNGTATGSQVSTTVTPQADVTVIVSGPATVLAGGTYTYTVSVTNLGPSVATNTLATNALPAGVVFVSTTGGGSLSNSAVSWPALTLVSGAGTNFTITVTAPPSGPLTNRASGASSTADPILTNNNGSAASAVVVTDVTPQADIAVGKSGPASVLATSNITYTISVTNFGPSTASNVVASDNLPAAATFVSASSGGTLGASNVVSWPATTLLSGAVTNFTVTVTAPASGQLTNRASATSPTGDPNPTNNVGTNVGAQVTTSVTPQADVAVTVGGPSIVLAGATYTYTVSFTNFGPSVATNALATNALPAGVVFISTTGGGSLSNSAVTWPAITLPAGVGTNFTITVTAPPSGVLTNRAAGASSTADPDLTNNNGSASGAVVTTTVTPQADVAVGKSGPASVLANSNITYTISVTNFGPSTASNVVASDNLPAAATFVSASSGGTLGASNLVTWPATTLLSGAVTNFTVTVTAPASGQLTNRASATSPTGDPNPTNNVGTNGGAVVTTAVTPQADVAVTVSGPATVLAGGTYTYVVSLTNFGPSVATNALATNALPAGVVFISTTGGGSLSNSAVTWPSIDLPSGAGTNFTITVTAPPSGVLTNRAAGASSTADPDLANNNGSASSAVVTTTVTPQADVAVGKSGPAGVSAGASFTYTISVTNLGPSTASNVVTLDNLPATVAFVGASGGGVLGGGNVVTWPAVTLLAGVTTNYTVTVTAPANGVFTNFASGSSPTGDPNPGNNTGTNGGAQVVTTIGVLADVAVTVSGPATVLAGGTYTYTVSFTNFGPSVATNALATNTLPAGVVFVSTTGGGSLSNSAVTWPALTLASGAGTNFIITVTAPPSGVLTNTAAGASSTPDPDLSNNNGSASGAVVTTTVTPQADVAVGKSGPATVLAASNITYTISVTNFGPSTASNVVASDNLPAAAIFVSASGGGTLGASNIVTWPATTLLSGAVTNFTVTVTAPASGVLLNRASATSPTGDPNPTNNVGTNGGAQVTTSVTPQADVAVTVSGPVTVLAGGTYTYVVSLTNFGPSVATNALATNTLPAGVIFISTTGGGSLSNSAVTWPTLTLPSGVGTNFTITVTAPPSGVLINTASGGSSTPDPNLTNNNGSALGAIVTTTVTPQADVAVSKTGPATVLAGANFSYTINLTNHGPSTASNVVVSDSLPAPVTFVGATGGGLLGGGNVVTWPAANLLSGGSAIYTITVTAPASGAFTNIASATSPTGDPNPTNNNGTAPGSQVGTTVIPQADVALGKTGPATVLAGASFTYTISVTNFGPSTASNVVTIDNLPAAATFVSASGGGTLGVSNIVTWPATTLLSGAVTNFTVTVTAPPSGAFTNTASATSPTGDPNPTNNNGSATGSSVSTTVTPQADVAVGKGGPASVLAGANFTYTISVTNFGPSIASNVVTVDNLPANLTFVSASGGGTLGLGNVVTWPALTLNAGATATYTVTVTAPASGGFVNTASASSPTGDPNPTNNNGTATGSSVGTTVTPQADIAVTVTGPTNVLAGSNITYTISVTNYGPSTATNVLATNSLPGGVVFVGTDGGGSFSNGVVTWPPTDLPAGTGTNFTITVTAPPSGSLTNGASGGSSTPDPDLVNNSSAGTGVVLTTVTPQADVAVGKSGPASVPAGSNFVYVISITNLGPSTASNIVAVDYLPGALIFVSASGGGVLDESHSVLWPATTLAAGAATNFAVVVTAPASGTFANRASAVSPTGDPNPGNNGGTNIGGRVVTTVIVGPQFGKLAAPAVFNPQTGLFEQRVTVTNIGLSTIAATRLYVTGLRSNVFFHNPSGSNAGVPYAQYNAPLNPGQTVVFTLEFFVPDRRPFTNTLTLEAVLPAVTGTNSGAGLNISRAFIDARLPGNPRYVIEFPTTPGRVYTILYSDDLTTWKVATPSVTATANSTQWYDDGPPKTESKPLTNGSRYYRVVVAPQP